MISNTEAAGRFALTFHAMKDAQRALSASSTYSRYESEDDGVADAFGSSSLTTS
jgi:hypothetical protein